MGRRIIVVCALLGALALGAAGAGSAATFTDAQGDAVGGGADVTQIDVVNDLDGNITFTFTLSNRSALGAEDELFVFLDTDNNVATGVSGIDFVIGATSRGVGLLRASGSTFVAATAATLSSSNGGRTVRVNRSDLAQTSAFPFYVLTRLAADESGGDEAPDRGVYLYTLQLKPVLESLAARFTPARPKAGKAFRVASTSLHIQSGVDVKPGSITCVAKLSGKRLPGRCSWRIPASAGGKRLVVIITARYRGASATFVPWRFRVAR